MKNWIKDILRPEARMGHIQAKISKQKMTGILYYTQLNKWLKWLAIIIINFCKWSQNFLNYNRISLQMLQPTHTELQHPFNGLFSRKTWVSRYHKGKTSLDLMRQAMMGFCDSSGISWTTCKHSAPRSRQITTPTPHQSMFTGRTLFLTPNQQCQNNEGKNLLMNKQIKQRQQKITYDNDMLHWDLKAFQIQSMYTGILVKQSILHVHNSTETYEMAQKGYSDDRKLHYTDSRWIPVEWTAISTCPNLSLYV